MHVRLLVDEVSLLWTKDGARATQPDVRYHLRTQTCDPQCQIRTPVTVWTMHGNVCVVLLVDIRCSMESGS